MAGHTDWPVVGKGHQVCQSLLLGIKVLYLSSHLPLLLSELDNVVVLRIVYLGNQVPLESLHFVHLRLVLHHFFHDFVIVNVLGCVLVWTCHITENVL